VNDSIRFNRNSKLGLRLIAAKLLPLLLAGGCAAQSAAKPTVLNDCTKVFGASIDTALNLFEVTPAFVLQPKFDDHDNLTVLSVFPKYWLEETHPEWTEPHHWPLFSPAEFQIVLTRLDNVISKGRLLALGTGGIVTNSTNYFLDRYEHAYVHHGNVIDDVRFFDVYPFHEIEGKVRKARSFTSLLGGEFYQALVGELVYFVEREQYRKLRLRRSQKILVVGPIKGFCYAGFCNP
jgi:hypothetical protein